MATSPRPLQPGRQQTPGNALHELLSLQPDSCGLEARTALPPLGVAFVIPALVHTCWVCLLLMLTLRREEHSDTLLHNCTRAWRIVAAWVRVKWAAGRRGVATYVQVKCLLKCLSLFTVLYAWHPCG